MYFLITNTYFFYFYLYPQTFLDLRLNKISIILEPISIQKEPPKVFCKKGVLKGVHRKTPVLESFFNKGTALLHLN